MEDSQARRTRPPSLNRIFWERSICFGHVSKRDLTILSIPAVLPSTELNPSPWKNWISWNRWKLTAYQSPQAPCSVSRKVQRKNCPSLPCVCFLPSDHGMTRNGSFLI